jgi:oligosaccharide reducing-end xylanase
MKTRYHFKIPSTIAGIFYLIICGITASAQTGKLDNGKGAFVTGKYPNLFKERGHSKKEIDNKINKAFNQLFLGNPDSEAVYFPAGKNGNGPLAYVSDVPHHDIRSEGMSYGMMIAVQLNRKDVFDAIWNYAMTNMYISDLKHPSEDYFSWSLKRDGTPNEETPAPDGEEYFVTSLYFASGRWGNGTGIYNYHQWADKILTTMRHHPIKSGMTKFGPRRIGPMVNEGKNMILFVPGVERSAFTDPSYHLPAFYELWARWGPKEDRAFWYAAADTSRAFFMKAANPETGLASDYANFDGSPRAADFNKNAVNFSFDSWRTASNWAVDWSWWHKAPNEQVLSDRIQAFFTSKGIDNYGCQFTLTGTQYDNRHANGLVATNAVTSLAATNANRNQFVDALWNAPVPQALVERYYDGLLYIMSLLHCSGNYKIYPPK